VPTTLSFAYDNALRDGRLVAPARLWWWGTRGGALALGRTDTGALAAGLAADFLELELPPWVETAEQVLAAILFDLDAARPVRTFVAGRVVYERAIDGVNPWAPPAP
jgi:cytosine/adenosine deaminase-related metal-dependent hydrolase